MYFAMPIKDATFVVTKTKAILIASDRSGARSTEQKRESLDQMNSKLIRSRKIESRIPEDKK